MLCKSWFYCCIHSEDKLKSRTQLTQTVNYLQRLPRNSCTLTSTVHALFNYGHRHVCVNGHTVPTVMHIGTWQSSTSDCLYLPYNCCIRYGTFTNTMHLCHSELLFAWMNTVQLYELPFLNKVINITMLMHEIYMHSCTYAPIWFQHLQEYVTRFQTYILHM